MSSSCFSLHLPLTLLYLTAVICPAAAEHVPFFLRDGDRVVFYGDSITAGEWYPAFIETYLLTRFPKWRNEVFVRGVGGDKASNIQRFIRDAIALHPDVLTFMMSYNDAGYERLNEEALDRFLGSVTEVVRLAREDNPHLRLLLVSDPMNELALSADPEWVSHSFYPFVLLNYARAERELAARLHVPFLNLTEEYGRTMALGHAIAPSAFGLSRDGVHPQQEGQFFIACHFLRAMRASPWVASTEIDAHSKKVNHSKNAVISDLTIAADGVVEFVRHAGSLPFPVPESVRAFAFLFEPEEALSRDYLTVSGLKAPSYAIEIDGRRIGEVSSAELVAGVNLSRWPGTPMYQQAMEVLAAVWRKQQAEQTLWARQIVETPAGEIAEARRTLEDLRAKSYRLNQPRPHRFRLIPQKNRLSVHQAALEHELSQAFLKIEASLMDAGTKQVQLDLENPGDLEKNGSITWNLPPGWNLSPASREFYLGPGERIQTLFAVSREADASEIPPAFTVRWKWSKSWPYPMQETRSLPVRPQLRVPHLPVAPDFSGDDKQWKHATTVNLDAIHFTNPRVPGKRRLWDGPRDLSARLFFGWTDDGLYVAAKVADDRQFSPAKRVNWSQDLLHLFIIVPEENGAAARYQFGFGLASGGDAQFLSLPPNIKPPPVFHIQHDKTTHTTFYEVRLPWQTLTPFKPGVSRTLLLNVAVDDVDDDAHLGKGFTSLEWTPGINYRNTPEYFPILELTEGIKESE